jgi:adenylate cyclase
MAEASVERRLAAILAADVAGYSRLMGADEVGTLAALKAHRRKIVDPAIAAHKGRIVKTTGDGMLVEFASVVDAVNCAVAVQKKMAERTASEAARIQFRVGINVGDIIIDGDDIFGDGVNVAARVENECEPGGVCLSGSAFDQVSDKTNFAFDDLGEKFLKNIDRPVRLYAVRQTLSSGAKAPNKPGANVLSLPDKPSIAVLPFVNMSGDPEQEYFADGMVEDVITGLSRSRSLFVIARNSSFTYKGKAVDIKQVGRELGVRYVLEGSVRKVGNKVRITGQLIEAAAGMHLWADRYDGALDDIFDLQDRVTGSVIAAMLPEIERAEIERAQRKPTESLRAYDYYLRALAASYRFTREANLEVIELAKVANQIDPEFALSYGLAAFTLTQRKAFGWSTDLAADVAEARRLSTLAIQFGKDDARVLALSGFALAYVVGDVEHGAMLVRQAIQLDPSLSLARLWMGWINVYLGNHDAAIEQIQVASRLNPLDPRRYSALTVMAAAHFFAGRDEEAWNLASTAVRLQPNYLSGQRFMVASSAVTGRIDEARRSCEAVLQIDPAHRISTVRYTVAYRPKDLQKLEKALRIAGLPE